MITLSTEKQQQVKQLLQDSPTRCVGRYLIDLPAGFIADKRMRFYYGDGNAMISTQQQYLPPFKQMLTLREQELKTTQPVRQINSPYLKAIYPLNSQLPGQSQGTIFERMESIGIPDVARVLEGYLWQDEVTIKIEMKANNGLATKYDVDREKDPELYGNNVPQKLAEIRTLFDRIAIRDDLTIPDEPSFCLLRSFIQGEDREWKSIDYGYHHNNIDNFSFYFTLNDYISDYALLDKPDSYFTQNIGHTIYKGTRNSHDLVLEEWVVKGPFFTDQPYWGSGGMGYIFKLGIHMTDPSYNQPQLRLEMFYKIPQDKTEAYSEDQLMVIWHKITSSIQLRSKLEES